MRTSWKRGVPFRSKGKTVAFSLSLLTATILEIGFPTSAMAAGQSGTTLSATVTAQGVLDETLTYDWKLTKSVNNIHPVINPGKSLNLTYTLKATRTLKSDVKQSVVDGTVTVTNGGSQTTQDLTITASLENTKGAVDTVTPSQQLAPKQTQSYPIEIVIPNGSSASSYKLDAAVTITNHSGHLNTPYGPTPKQGSITIPTTATVKTIDGSATVTDAPTVPTGFTYSTSTKWPWTIDSSNTLTYTATVKNVSGTAKMLDTLTNTATLVEGTTKTKETATQKVIIFTGCGCAPK